MPLICMPGHNYRAMLWIQY